MKTWRVMVMVAAGACVLTLAGCDDNDNVPTVPTVVPTKTAVVENTNTPKPVATATSVPATATAAATATETGPVGPTATPTETPMQGAGLGTREVSIAVANSGFFTSALAGVNVAASFVGGPIKLVAGDPDSDGIAQVTVAEDVVAGAGLIAGQGAVCVKIFAQGSTGQVDCDGGSPNDVTVTLDSHGSDAGGDFTIETGQGADGGAGAMTLVVMQSTAQEGAGFDPNDCASADFGAPTMIAYTTGTGTAVVMNAVQGGTVMLSKTGSNVDCSTWTSGTGAVLISPVPAEEILAGTDGANIVVVGEPSS